MAHKKEWLQSADLPEGAWKMLSKFEQASGLHDGGYTVTHIREDAVFVQVYGICNVYVLARLASQCADIYFELQADAPRYWTLRMFSSAWIQEKETALRLPTIYKPISDFRIQRSVLARKDRA